MAEARRRVPRGADRLEAQALRLQRANLPPFVRALTRAFGAQARIVIRAWEASGGDLARMLAALPENVLFSAMLRHIANQHVGSRLLAQGFLAPLEPQPPPPAPPGAEPRIPLRRAVTERISVQTGLKVRRVNARTVLELRRQVQLGREYQLLPSDMAYGREDRPEVQAARRAGWRPIRDVVQETYRGRARTIARTELALAHQAGSLDEYGRAGISEVVIRDSPDCGWIGHGHPRKPNGKVYPIGIARTALISHPNCVRRALPILPTL